MSIQNGFIITKEGIIAIEYAYSAGAYNALSQVARQIADDAARLSDAWQNSDSIVDFVQQVSNGNGFGAAKIVGAVAFGTATAAALPVIVASLPFPGAIAIASALKASRAMIILNGVAGYYAACCMNQTLMWLRISDAVLADLYRRLKPLQ